MMVGVLFPTVMTPKKARQIDSKHMYSSARINSKNLPPSRAIETLKSSYLANKVCLERRKEEERVS